MTKTSRQTDTNERRKRQTETDKENRYIYTVRLIDIYNNFKSPDVKTKASAAPSRTY